MVTAAVCVLFSPPGQTRRFTGLHGLSRVRHAAGALRMKAVLHLAEFPWPYSAAAVLTPAPFGSHPQRLGAVYQRIQPRKQKVDNIVEISLPAPVPFAPPLKASATLSHTLEVTGDRTIRIDFDSITFRPQGLRVPLRPITLPVRTHTNQRVALRSQLPAAHMACRTSYRAGILTHCSACVPSLVPQTPAEPLQGAAASAGAQGRSL